MVIITRHNHWINISCWYDFDENATCLPQVYKINWKYLTAKYRNTECTALRFHFVTIYVCDPWDAKPARRHSVNWQMASYRPKLRVIQSKYINLELSGPEIDPTNDIKVQKLCIYTLYCLLAAYTYQSYQSRGNRCQRVRSSNDIRRWGPAGNKHNISLSWGSWRFAWHLKQHKSVTVLNIPKSTCIFINAGGPLLCFC